MSWLNDKIDILIAKLAIWSIRRGYYAQCEEYAEGCLSCEAKKVTDWLQWHIDMVSGKW